MSWPSEYRGGGGGAVLYMLVSDWRGGPVLQAVLRLTGCWTHSIDRCVALWEVQPIEGHVQGIGSPAALTGSGCFSFRVYWVFMTLSASQLDICFRRTGNYKIIHSYRYIW